MPIDFKNVSYIYGRKTPFEHLALSNINLHIDDHEFIALVGKTGSGKSTLIQHINALLNPSEGEVDVDDFINSANKKTRTKKLNPLRKKVGLVFQFPEYQLFEETVEKDVAFAPRNFGASKEEALDLAHKALLRVGLDKSFFERSPFELSGGEKRKVAIAGILAMSPKVLVVDEPTAGLDPLAAMEMMDLFKSIYEEGTSIILVTHDMNVVAKYANKVVVLDNSKIDQVTSPSELFKGDIEKYSLETPALYQTAKNLNKKGYHISLDSLVDVKSLAHEIALEKGKHE